MSFETLTCRDESALCLYRYYTPADGYKKLAWFSFFLWRREHFYMAAISLTALFLTMSWSLKTRTITHAFLCHYCPFVALFFISTGVFVRCRSWALWSGQNTLVGNKQLVWPCLWRESKPLATSRVETALLQRQHSATHWIMKIVCSTLLAIPMDS